MPYVLALASAALYGAADFLGGLSSRRASTIVVVVVSQLAGLVLLLMLLPVLPPAAPARADLMMGAAAGLFGSTGVALLYRALAVGTMGIVAPTTAVCAVAIPVLASLAMGQWPSAIAGTGIGLAAIAIALVSRQPTPPAEAVAPGRAAAFLPPGLALAFASGVAIGLFFLSLARTSPDAGLWPLVSARLVSVGLFGAVGVIRRHPMRMPGRVLAMVVVGGMLDMLANALYVLAVRQGPLAAVVTLSSLYPASTVLLARIVLGERMSGTQIAGIVCALVAVLLIVR